mmetsp:Transcript_7391/g.14880  ORF Transcript_7391/g.14880 Transcript_7391/m.14880 type:complete len:441 (-) Transcript_7391:56-1378(-)|eukprot:CAMPEP_0118646106 /NCGR_PEP_ID=MMETSP0785-20121206/7867_1 /TAXON_ID=91992 /ORGANISM="Bolidomonas pacifica, Strain CCMP 1866" /LENGTH=440 /DNA_ID=CAMNT_0006538053 /DNA_START=214 /DNA_END=1536 /DNA_ORIENTATION=-
MPRGKRKATDDLTSNEEAVPAPPDGSPRLRLTSADSEGGSEFVNWLIDNADTLNQDEMLAQAAPGTFDPIPVSNPGAPMMQQQQQPGNPVAPMMGAMQQPPAAPYGMPPQQFPGAPNTFQQQQQQQINQIQQMLMMQQQTLQKITEALPVAGSGGGSRGASPVPNSSSSAGTATTSKSSGSGSMLPPAVRRAKKPQNGEYEERLRVLKEENERLKRHLTSVNNKSIKVTEEKKKSMEDMERIVKRFKDGEKLDDSSSDKKGKGKDKDKDKDVLMTSAGLQAFIKEYTDMYSDYGIRRLDELTFHLGQLERLVMPTTTTKMGLWTLEQDDKFFENTARGSLAGILSRELQISEAQKLKIVSHREEIKKITANLKRTLDLLVQLKDTVQLKHQLFSERMEKCTRILKPVQVIKLLLWVHKNEVELREVCPGWGSEQIIENRN